MTKSALHDEIDRLVEGLDGALISRARVIDTLLDVRCATDDRQLIAFVDNALRNVPGRNLAETSWLRDQLTDISIMHDLSPDIRAEFAAVS